MKMRTWTLGALAIAALAGSAQGQVFDNCVDATTPVGIGTYDFDLSTATNDAAGTCGATGTAQDLWINFRPTESANCIVTTCGISFFDTVLAAYAECGGTPIICVDDSCGLQTTIQFPVTANTSYFIRIADFAGGTGAGQVNITLDTAPTNPEGVGAATPDRATQGATSLLTVAVTPGVRPDSTGLVVTADLSQIDAGNTAESLFDDGTNGDAVAGDLTFSRLVTVGPNAAGGNQTIGFTVQDAQSRRTDGSIAFFVTPPPPANDNCDSATAVTATSTFDFDTQGATVDGTASCGAAANSPDVWYRCTFPLSGNMIVSTCGISSMDTVLTVFDACGGTQLICLDDFCGLQTQINVSVTADTPVWVRLAGFAGQTGTGQISFTAPELPPANDNCANAAVIALDATVDFDTRNATNDGSPSCGTSTAGDVWFRFTAAAAGTFRAATCGSALDTIVSVYDGCGGAEIACNDDACGLQSRADFAASAGQQVWIRVGGFLNDAGTGSITVSSIVPPYMEDGDAGDLPDTAQVPSGSGSLSAISGNLDPSDADMYRIRICDYANFSASTVGGAGFDTQLFLFNTDGMGVTFNDDSGTLQSRITAQFVTADGDYLLALSGYNHDATDIDGAIIWANTPFGVERQPDGPGAANAIAGWSGAGGGGSYTIEMTGVCYGGGPRCIADVDDGTGTGTPDGGVTIDDLLYYLVIYGDGNIAADVDNGTFTGTQDGGVTIDDLLYFLFRYGEGC